MMSELFTITIPVFNRYDYFEQAINSAVNQTVKCKILVVDNASEHDRFSSYVKRLNNPLVSYHRNNQNIGMVGNWNKCIELATTPWVSILHDDDVLHPRFLETVLKVININPDIGLLAGIAVVGEYIPKAFLNGHVREIPEFKLIKNTYFLYRNLSPFPGVAFKKSLVEKAGYFDESLHPVSDLYFWYRIASITKTAVLDEKLSYYRISASQETVPNIAKLIDLSYKFNEMVLRENKMTDVISKLSVLWSRQQHIDYYNNTYPGSKLKNSKFEILWNNPGVARVMYRIRDAKSFV